MRRKGLTRRFAEDPLLKVGAGAMILAVGFAIVVAFAAYLDRPIEPATAKPEVKSATEPLARSNPGVDPWVEKDIPPPRYRAIPLPARLPESHRPSDPRPGPPAKSGSAYGSSPDESRQTLPVDDYDYPLPTDRQLRAANQPRHYNFPPGAIMSLTINALESKERPRHLLRLHRSPGSGGDPPAGHFVSLVWNPGEERVSGRTQAGMAGHRKPPRLLPPKRAR